MTMIIEKLNCKIKDMRKLFQREELAKNAAQQLVIDRKYHELVIQVHLFLDTVSYTRMQLKFQFPETVSNKMDLLLQKLRMTVESGYADQESLSECDKLFKEIQADIKKEWKLHYSAITAAVLGTLKVIKGIDKDRVERCLEDIKAAEQWQADKKIFIDLASALERSDVLIQDLNMDQEIIAFLKKMNLGKATVSDLNEKVLSWIQKEALSDRIKISFTGK